MNSKNDSKLITIKKTNKPKKTNKQKKTLSKQLEQEQIHRNRDHVEGYQWGGRGGRMGRKIQRVSSRNGRYKINKGKLRIVWEM